MRKELLYAAPIAGMIAIPILKKRIAPGVEAVVYAAEKTVNAGDTCRFTVVFKNKGGISTNVSWMPKITPEGGGDRNLFSTPRTFTISGGETLSQTVTFTMPTDIYGNVDLRIDYSYDKGGAQVTEGISYKQKYGKYAWYVRGLPDIEIESITIQ